MYIPIEATDSGSEVRAKINSLSYAENIKVSDEIATLYGQNVATASVDSILSANNNLSSYMVFAYDTNATKLDIAFGKNNVDLVVGIGLQLAMAGWYKGESRSAFPYNELRKCGSLQTIKDNTSAFNELKSSVNLKAIVNLSPFATSILGTL